MIIPKTSEKLVKFPNPLASRQLGNLTSEKTQLQNKFQLKMQYNPFRLVKCFRRSPRTMMCGSSQWRPGLITWGTLSPMSNWLLPVICIIIFIIIFFNHHLRHHHQPRLPGKTSGPFACSDIEEQTGKYGSNDNKCSGGKACRFLTTIRVMVIIIQ